MCTGIVVVSLPYFKCLIWRESGSDSSTGSTNKNAPNSSDKPVSGKGGISSNIRGGKADDEVELVFLDRQPSACPTGDTGGSGFRTRTEDGKDAVIITTDVSVMSMRHMDMS